MLTGAAAALAGVLLAVAPAAAAVAPEPPAVDALTSENAGGLVLEREGSRVSIGVDADGAYAYVYPAGREPIGVGWLAPADGAVRIDLSLMPAGEVLVALLDTDGALLGWAGTELDAAESNAPGPTPPPPEETAAPPGPVADAPWPLALGGAAAGLAALAVVAALIRRRSAP